MTSPQSDRVVFATKWFRLVETPAQAPAEPFYRVESPDCVTILALTPGGTVPLVRQYRPVLDAYSLELPSGHVDPTDASHEDAARRELSEETGYQAGRLHRLGSLDKDVGRLRAQVWGFFAAGSVKTSAPRPDHDEQLELVEAPLADVLDWARQGKLRHAQDLAVILLARLNGFI
jgi:ADP-ribose pyrophosphatase